MKGKGHLGQWEQPELGLRPQLLTGQSSWMVVEVGRTEAEQARMAQTGRGKLRSLG